MKKLLSLIAVMALFNAAQAQQHPLISRFTTEKNNTSLLLKKTGQKQHTPQAKATAAAFFSESFDAGLPAGWATGVYAGPSASWKWYPNGQVSQSQNAIGPINTGTGFMIYDSDSIGALNPATAHAGYITTSAISCSGHATVALKFNEYFRRSNDSTFVEVSTNAVNWTPFPVSYNNTLVYDAFTAPNPHEVFVNISSVAANQPAVYLRFSYHGPPGGGYSWQVDNVTLSELDPTDVGLHNSFLFNQDVGAYSSSIANVPLVFADSISPVTLLSNYGANAQAGFSVNAKIFQNNTQVYNQSQVVSTLPYNAVDSFVQFPYYMPNAVGDYVVAYSLSLAGNANTTELTDTVRFTITDSVWSQNLGDTISSEYIHRPSALGERSLYMGTRFDVPAGAVDTLQQVGVAFGSNTSVGTEVQVQIYKLDVNPANGWNPIYTTYTHVLTAAEISTPTNIVYAPILIDNATGPAVFDEGTWAVVVTTINVPAATTVSVLCSSSNPATPYAGYFGQEDTSLNDGSYSFGFQTQATGIYNVPLINLQFGLSPTPGGVWPGDVNYDHIVNNYDALDILPGFGSTGVIRPNASNTFSSQPCTDWGTFIVPGVDMKNADCDGDGTVGYSDTVAIWANYGQSHPKGTHTAQPKASGLPDLYFDLAAISFTAGTTVHVPIKLGTTAQPMNNILALAAQVKIAGISLQNSPSISYATSWMGNAANLLNFTKDVNSNQTDWVIGRTDHTNVSGDGTIATLNIDIPTNASGQAVLYFDNVKAIDNAGNVINGYNVLDDTATVQPAYAANIVNTATKAILVPNPSTSQCALQVTLPSRATLQITITDVMGRKIFEAEQQGVKGLQNFALPANRIVPGIYTVQVRSDAWSGTETLKWIKN